MKKLAILAAPFAAALALAACGETEKTYEVDATDESGGELIVTEEDPAAVDVEVPEATMTNVPADGAEAPAETDAAAQAE